MKYQRTTEIIDGIVSVEDVSQSEVNEIKFMARMDKMAEEATKEIASMIEAAKINRGLIAVGNADRGAKFRTMALQQLAAQNLQPTNQCAYHHRAASGGALSGLLGAALFGR